MWKKKQIVRRKKKELETAPLLRAQGKLGGMWKRNLRNEYF